MMVVSLPDPSAFHGSSICHVGILFMSQLARLLWHNPKRPLLWGSCGTYSRQVVIADPNSTLGPQPTDLFSLEFDRNDSLFELQKRFFGKQQYRKYSLDCYTCVKGVCWRIIVVNRTPIHSQVTILAGSRSRACDTRGFFCQLRSHLCSGSVTSCPAPPRPCNFIYHDPYSEPQLSAASWMSSKMDRNSGEIPRKGFPSWVYRWITGSICFTDLSTVLMVPRGSCRFSNLF